MGARAFLFRDPSQIGLKASTPQTQPLPCPTLRRGGVEALKRGAFASLTQKTRDKTHMNTETAGQVSATKAEIIALLRSFVNQRPGLDFANYGEIKSYRAELRGITRQRADAIQLLRAVELRDSIEAGELVAAFPRAYSGRLELVETKGKLALNYCAGQYFPTEYRAAVCAVLARCLWHHWANHFASPNSPHHIRETAKSEFGRGIASRWFN